MKLKINFRETKLSNNNEKFNYLILEFLSFKNFQKKDYYENILLVKFQNNNLQNITFFLNVSPEYFLTFTISLRKCSIFLQNEFRSTILFSML